jgi:PIH1 CS-like domain
MKWQNPLESLLTQVLFDSSKGTALSIPYSCGAKHGDKWDIVFNTETFTQARKNARLMNALIETAAEAVGSKGQWNMVQGGPRGKLVNTFLKGDGDKEDGVKGVEKQEKGKEVVKGKQAEKGKEVPKGFYEKKPTQNPKPTPKAVEPAYKIVHQTLHTDFQKFTSGPTLRPDTLAITVSLPLLTSAASVDLDVTSTSFHLGVDGMYKLDIKLPFEVDTAGSAEFCAEKRVLTVTVKVLKKVVEKEPVQMVEETDICFGG